MKKNNMQIEQPIASYNGKPEIDDGHTKIANELLDAIICSDFSKRQLKILLFIIRKTYGWNKSEDDISRSQIVDETGIKSPHVTTTIQELLELNVIIVSNGTYAKKYKINKYYDTWRFNQLHKVTETVIITETVINSYQNSNKKLPKQYPQKTTTKDNTKDKANNRKKLELITLHEYLKQCKENKVNPIKDNDTIFDYADSIKLSMDFLYLAWDVFKDKYINENKKYKDWASVYRKAVKDNWFKLWYLNSNNVFELTTVGKQYEMHFQNKKDGN